MTCSDFLETYTDFRDGTLPVAKAGRCMSHLQTCPACRRYDEVLSRGVELLKAMPPEEPSGDFRSRLQHSIYTLHEERRRRRVPRAGPGAMSLAAMFTIVTTVILTLVLWESEAVVDLPAIVAERPATRGLTVIPAPIAPPVPTQPFQDLELWARSNTLLYEHSSLYHRHREPGLVRAGLR